jgi:hypothetical protein
LADGERVLVEMLPLMADSKASLPSVFERLCQNATVKSLVLSCTQIEAAVPVNAVFATPVF